MKISGKVALITGGASGLGQAALEAFVGRGASVAIFDLNEESSMKIVNAKDGSVRFYKTDVASEESVKESINNVINDFGAIHVCINCAGFGISHKTYSRRSGPHPLDHFQKTLNVNLVGTFNVLRLASEKMAKNDPVEDERGVIINTASIAYIDGQAGQVAYSASKAGIVGMTLPIARDLASLGIRVNAIAPGVMATPMMMSAPKELIESLESQVQFPKRLGCPDEFGALAAHIVENGYLNGEVLRLDGAIRM